MPRAYQPAQGEAYEPAQGAVRQHAQDTGWQQPAQGQAAQHAPYSTGYRAQEDTAQRVDSHRAEPSRHAAQPQAQKKAPSAGKTFLFGFLGALLACAIGLGGFIAYNAFAHPAGTSNAATNVALGTTDSTVINAVEEGQTLAEAVAAKALPSVVGVYNYQKQSTSGYGQMFGFGYGANSQSSDEPVEAGMGSGVVISQDGYILTNYHVVENAAKITVTVDGKERDATYVGGDSSSDVAVIKVDDTSGLVVADIGDSDDLHIGEWVMTIGAPLGLEQSVATGVISATNRSTIMDDSSSGDMFGYYTNSTPEYTYYPNMIQTDAVINPGNSGGALVDADGKLIGINSIISSYSGNYAGVGFAIPVNYAIGLAEDIIAGKEPSHAVLGVSISQVNSQVARRYNLAVDTGAYVNDVVAGSGAEAAGIQVGDIITAIGDKTIASTTDVTLDVREHAVGETVKVTVNRNGETLELDVKLSSDDELSYNTDTTTPDAQGQGQGQGQDQGQGQGQG
ncbi:MAG TPA: peptidase S1, partial [Eggerthellaceae bacterium]|nr:peptidase S1 [Eggerthellaceae bacterium]